jgi:serine/threonine protein kinase
MSSRNDRPPYKRGDIIGYVYEIGRVLAEGGFSVVYEALDVSVSRTVAVKVLRPGVARMRAYSREQMRRECEVLVKLREVTPHVVDVLTAGIDHHDLPYYVMERLRGTTLRRSIAEKQRRREPFSVEEVLTLGTTIATTLVRAHELGVIHRDLKPENVFMALRHGGDVEPKLLDFGLCVDADGQNEISEPAWHVCSLPYAAPEQVERGHTSTVTDVYALGLVLVELLTLWLPHGRSQPGLTTERLELALMEMPVPDLSEARPDAPGRLVRLITRCLGATKKSRPSAHEVAKELRDTKLEREGRLGPKDDSTDVDGFSIDELHQRMEITDHSTSGGARVVTTDVGARSSTPANSGDDMFFVRAVPIAEGAGAVVPDKPDRTQPLRPLTALDVNATVVDPAKLSFEAGPENTVAFPPPMIQPLPVLTISRAPAEPIPAPPPTTPMLPTAPRAPRSEPDERYAKEPEAVRLRSPDPPPANVVAAAVYVPIAGPAIRETTTGHGAWQAPVEQPMPRRRLHPVARRFLIFSFSVAGATALFVAVRLIYPRAATNATSAAAAGGPVPLQDGGVDGGSR